MIRYAVRRLLLAVSMVWGVSFSAFVAFGLSFDPTYNFNFCMSKPECRRERAHVIAVYHLHDGILHRYWLWLTGLFEHGFGTNANDLSNGYAGYPIGSEVWPAARVTAELVGSALVLTVVLSVVVGVVAARFPGTPLDWLLRLLAYVAWSMPAFLVGALAARALGHVEWFNLSYVDKGFGGWLRWMSLPALTLSLGLVGLYSRYIRSGMLVELRRPYTVVARAKGLPESRVVLRHALRNSLVPFVSVLSLDLASAVGAALATEYVYGMHGLARLFLGSLGADDPFLLTAILVVVGAVVAVASFVADLTVGWLDPRVRAASLR